MGGPGGGRNTRVGLVVAVLAVLVVAALVAGGLWFTGRGDGTDETAGSTTTTSTPAPPAPTGNAVACVDAVVPVDAPIGAPAPDAGGLPGGTGSLGEPSWAIPVEVRASYELSAVYSDAEVVAVSSAPLGGAPTVLVGLGAGDGAVRYSVQVEPAPIESSVGDERITIAGDRAWVAVSGREGPAAAGIDLTTGQVVSCLPLPESGIPALQVASGRVFAMEYLPNRDGAYRVSLLGETGPEWTVEGLFDTILSVGDGQVVALGNAGDWLYRTTGATVAVLSADDGTVRSVTPLRELTVGLTSLDGSPEPVWQDDGVAGSIEGLVSAYTGGPEVIGHEGGATFAFSPVPGVRSSDPAPYSMYLLSLDLDGRLVWGGWVWKTLSPLTDAGDGHVWVKPPAAPVGVGATPPRDSWLYAGPGEVVEVGDQYLGNSGPGGLSQKVRFEDIGTSGVLYGPEGETGRVPGLSPLYSSGSLPTLGAVSVHGWVTVVNDDTGTAYLVRYLINGGGGGEGGGDGERPAPAPAPSPDGGGGDRT